LAKSLKQNGLKKTASENCQELKQQEVIQAQQCARTGQRENQCIEFEASDN